MLSRCRQAFFCSQACLERSYERHKPDCTRLRMQRKARERAEAKGKEAEQGEEREEAEAEAELRRRAEAGYAEAGCALGEALMARGEAAEAVKWVRWAAEEKGHTGAM